MNTNDSPALPPVALIAGPTASGKSALALALAEATDGIVINADASQVYRDLPILSAMPTAQEQARAPHRLYGYLDGAIACSAAQWAADARAEIAAAHAAGHMPILVGGTGLYIRFLLDGAAPLPAIDPAIRDAVRALPIDDAHAALLREDPAAGARLHPADKTRIARALEVVRATGTPLATWQQRREGGIGDMIRLAPLILLPPRDWLHARCDSRFSTMLDDGAIAEVEALRARGLAADLPAMRAIGVREISAFLDGAIDRVEMESRGRIATRQYAKRQYTWFRHQPPKGWNIAETKLDDDSISRFVIKLRIMALTG